MVPELNGRTDTQKKGEGTLGGAGKGEGDVSAHSSLYKLAPMRTSLTESKTLN